MDESHEHEIRVFRDGDRLPREAEEMFAVQLADSRRPLPEGRPDRGAWSFALTCAVDREEHVLGGVHLDLGPINGAGPLAKEKLAYLESVLVRTDHRRRGLATALLRRAIEVAAEAGCLYIRCSGDWDNEAEIRLFLRCGFGLVDLNGEEATDRCYLAVRPLRNLPVGPA